MTIDAEAAKKYIFPQVTAAWDAKDVILYHLGVGAGDPADDPRELEYLYEARLKVLPTFAMVVYPAGTETFLAVDGVDFDPRMLLHGEQELIVHRPLPVSAEAHGQSRIVDVYDKGKAAVIVTEGTSLDGDGNKLFTTRGSLFVRGAGGFGGSSGPHQPWAAPTRRPDLIVDSKTLERQALLYRLNGDLNPLHIDPEYALAGGFERPILHGLATYGIVCKAVVDRVLDGDVTAIAEYRTRFAGIVYPGETIVSHIWIDGDRITVEASTKERGTPVLTRTELKLRG